MSAAAKRTIAIPKGLSDEAWRIADRLGWAKTYDAEYLALLLAERGKVNA
jgi:hypothetical protein